MIPASLLATVIILDPVSLSVTVLDLVRLPVTLLDPVLLSVTRPFSGAAVVLTVVGLPVDTSFLSSFSE